MQNDSSRGSGSETIVNSGSEDHHHLQRRSVYLLLENLRKSNNLGPILRCASAFGITTVIAVGYAKCAVEGKACIHLFKQSYLV